MDALTSDTRMRVPSNIRADLVDFRSTCGGNAQAPVQEQSAFGAQSIIPHRARAASLLVQAGRDAASTYPCGIGASAGAILLGTAEQHRATFGVSAEAVACE